LHLRSHRLAAGGGGSYVHARTEGCLCLPFGGRHFWSRRAYELAYASQRETKYDRALRRARKLRLRLGGDPADDEYPDKPPRMRWATYNRLMDKLVTADERTEHRHVVFEAALS
jgi:hypothetical protein